ncbi:VOC family protein [Halorubrum sp. Atlit-28R]|uniref:VOC family protein n=1 Tax=Halorubrum sp. Atlit-28R TaxID=2282129 RepID=UPI000EF24488|nr:VOC family protein [Halorubrum sp. Atlit-28R]RLM49903.1 hypothetical protein DVK06_12770 [Halorubrum sp. Atlit-28R]
MTTSVEIDHIFLMTTPGAPAADEFVDEGITEGASRVHPGQGTANRRFVFDNVMFEFLWVHDTDEAGSDLVRPTHLLERWRQRDTGGSPFGLCFRPAPQTSGTPPFTTWGYEPPYLPADLDIKVADNAPNLGEPFLFFLPWAQPPDGPSSHDAGMRTLTEIIVHTPASNLPSDALRSINRLIRLENAESHHMTLVFDEGIQGETVELHPTEPLTIRY